MNENPKGSSISPQQLRAVVLLVQEIFAQLDEVASLLRRGGSAQLSRSLLSEMCAVLGEVDHPLLRSYFDVLCVTGAARSARVIGDYSSEFAEHSVTSKRMLITKLRDDLLAAA